LQGATGSLAGGVRFRNIGHAACSLTGRLRIRAELGRLVSRAMAPITSANAGLIMPRRGIARAIPPGREVGVNLWWSNWCPQGSSPGALVFALPHGGGTLRARQTGGPRCDAPTQPSSIGVSPFTPVGRQPAAATHLPFGASMPGTAHAKAGSTLRFVVTLRLTAKEPYGFARCPAVWERLDPDAKAELHVLNCGGLGTLQPGERVRFAMEIRIPRDSYVGNHGLFWELGPLTANPPNTSARVVVAK